MDFNRQIEKWSKEVLASVEKTQRSACGKLAESVIRDTPVDTGRARANWQAGVNQTPTGVKELFSPNLEETAAEINRILDKLKLGDTFILVNNLDYVSELEDGSSRQAPNGMLKRNLARWPELVKDAAAKAGKS